LSRDAKSWVIVSPPSAAHANGEVACLEDILLQNKKGRQKENIGVKLKKSSPKQSPKHTAFAYNS